MMSASKHQQRAGSSLPELEICLQKHMVQLPTFQLNQQHTAHREDLHRSQIRITLASFLREVKSHTTFSFMEQSGVASLLGFLLPTSVQNSRMSFFQPRENDVG